MNRTADRFTNTERERERRRADRHTIDAEFRAAVRAEAGSLKRLAALARHRFFRKCVATQDFIQRAEQSIKRLLDLCDGAEPGPCDYSMLDYLATTAGEGT